MKNKFKEVMNRDTVEFIIIIVAMFFVLKFIIMPTRINGSSMQPNFENGDYGFMVRTSIKNDIKRYNAVVVIIENPQKNNKKQDILKRVFGLPNETIEIKDNEIYINDKIIEDEFRIEGTDMDDLEKTKLGKDEYFILGDNREMSLDSRIRGIINKEKIKAVGGVRVWPLNKIGSIK